MTVRVRCPNPECGRTYRVPDERLGETATCKQCGRTFILEAVEAGTIYPLDRATTGTELPAADPNVPKELGRFKIRSRLGSGAFGTVYQAHDPVLDREVALKVPRAAALEKPEARARFLREPKAAAQLRHPNIVPVYDAGVDGDRYYIASAYIEGRTLEDVIDEDRPDFRGTARIVADLAVALDYAHRTGVVHRDVKPANIMIDRQGQPLLMDFGLARLETSEEKLTQDGSLMGTPAYMAPEQADRSLGEVGPASDQYSLGVVLYELLTGQTPFAGPPTVLLFNVINQQPPAPRSVDRQIPRDLETICLKAMAKRPQNRFADCGALADDLRRWLADEPIRARRMGSVERFRRWCRRNPVVAVLSASTVALLLLVAVTASVGYVRTSQALRTAQAERRNAEYNLYVNSIGLAHQKWLANDVTQAGQLLESCPTAWRGWEWYYLHRLCHMDLLTIEAHPGPVYDLAFSPDGRRIASGAWDGTVGVWDAANGKAILTLRGHSLPVRHVAFSPDGRRIGSFSGDQTVRLRDAETGRELLALKKSEPKSIGGVAFSPDGRRVVFRDKNTLLKICETETGKEVLTLSHDCQWLACSAFTPDGKRVAAGGCENGGGVVVLWDATTGEELTVLHGHSDGIRSLAFFGPDGDFMVTAANDRTIKAWNLDTGEQMGSETVDRSVVCLAVSPDGSQVAAGDEGSIVLGDIEAGRLKRTFHGAGWGVAFSPDGSRLVAGNLLGEIRVWDLEGSPEQGRIPDAQGCVAFSPDGRRVATSSNGLGVAIWDAAGIRRLALLSEIRNPISDVAFSVDGKRIVAAQCDKVVKVWDLATRRELLTLDHQGVWNVAYSPDGKRLATRDLQRNVKIWNASTGEALGTIQHPDVVTCVAFSSDREWIATGCGDKRARIWDDATSETIALQHPEAVTSVAFGPDAKRLVTATNDSTVRVWDVATGKQLLSLQGHTAPVQCVAYSPDGMRIASGGMDNTVRLWDAGTGRELLTFPEHPFAVMTVAFSSDGTRLASASQGGTGEVRIWYAPKE